MGTVQLVLLLVGGVWTTLVDATIPGSNQKNPIFDLRGPVPVLHVQGKTIAEVIYAEDGRLLLCRLHELDEEYEAEDIVKNSSLPVKYPSFKGMLHLIRECSKFPIRNNTDITDYEEVATSPMPNINLEGWSSWALWRGILPGTKWCGMGDIATSFDDLGTEFKVDTCCRSHDLCPIKLKSFRSGYGLVNFSFYTKSHCDCDHEFYGCLKDTQNQYSDVVGNVYFNLMRIQCLKDRQTFVCVQNRTDTDGSQNCVRWEVDPNSQKMQMTLLPTKY